MLVFQGFFSGVVRVVECKLSVEGKLVFNDRPSLLMTGHHSEKESEIKNREKLGEVNSSLFSSVPVTC